MKVTDSECDINYLTSLLIKATQLHQKGHLDEAQIIYNNILLKFPNHPDTLNLLGILFYQKGSFYDAIVYHQKAIVCASNRADFFHNLANAQRAVGLKTEALNSYKAAISLDPNYLNAFVAFGSLLEETGKANAAVKCYKKAILIDKTEVRIWFLLGNAYLQVKNWSKAIDCFEKAIECDSGYASAYNGLGVVFKELNDHEKAIIAYQKAIDLMPDNAQVHFNLGYSYYQNGNYAEAVKSYQKALKIKPSWLMALQNIGNAYLEIGNFQAAVFTYQKALAINHSLFEIHNNLGMAYRQLENIEDSIICFLRALELKPEFEKALKNVGLALKDQGKTQEALTYFDKLLKYYPKLEYEILRAMIAPIIYDSNEMILSFRKKFQNKLTDILLKNGTLEDPFRQVGVVNFILGMHGCKEKEIREKIVQLYLKFCPYLEWESPNLNQSTSPQKIHIGFVSDFLREHTIGRLYHGLIEKLSKAKFKISIFRFNQRVDLITQRIDEAADQVLYLPKKLELARKMIAEHKLDLLFYPELGMDPFTYFLSFSRLAPVQCKRGYPITMGIPNIDYFISSSLVEPNDAQDHYSEELILLKRTGYYYYRPEMPCKLPTREELKLPEQKRLYTCPHSLFKLHPDFDAVLGKILRKDTEGILVLLKGKYQHWDTLLLERFKKTIPDVIDKIYFVPNMQREKFITLFLIADAVLDPIHVSGGNTSLECLGLGIPVITWPGHYLIGRWTYGFYRQMEIMDCVASDLEHYAELAVRLANDKKWYAEIKDKIKKRSPVLFEDSLAVKELEAFFEWAVNKAHRDCNQIHFNHF